MRSSLCACCTPAVLRLLQDDAREVLLRPVVGPRLRHACRGARRSRRRQHAVRREALHREGSGDPDLPLVLVGLVVEVLVVGLGGDGGVDLLLPGDAGLPPQSACVSTASAGQDSDASRGISHSSQSASSAGVQVLAQRLHRLLPAFPDDVDLGVVGDGLERDVRHALVDEALADVARASAPPRAPCA